MGRTAVRRVLAGMVVCAAALGGSVAQAASADDAIPASAGASIPGSPAEGSRPGAPVTIYLDFDGEVLEDHYWNRLAGASRLDFAPSAAATPALIQAVWASVAEDYAPFDINVTTTRPGDDRLYKTSEDDEEYGAHAIITDSDIVPEKVGTAGYGWIGGAGSEYYEGAIILPITMGGGDSTRASAKAIAEGVSHEVGHNFGLDHQGIDDGSGVQEYYAPLTGVWGPIMGQAELTPVSQWTRGDYRGANHRQDDIAAITDRSGRKDVSYDLVTDDGASYAGAVCPVGDADLADPKKGDRFQKIGARGECDGTGAALTPLFTYVDRADPAQDRVGDDASHATKLKIRQGSASVHGVIERQDDVDVFRVVAGDGELKARVAVTEVSPDLDAKLEVTDEAGRVVAEDDEPTVRESDDVATGLGAEISVQVPAGVYYLSVDGVGSGDPSKAGVEDAQGYSDYGSLGNYELSVSTAPAPSSTPSAPADGGSTGGGMLFAIVAGAAGVLVVVVIVVVLSRRRSRKD
ncbi:MAG: hypothetical protein LBU78_09770 [Microbacterium sp.]|jgi:hypothetical protein|nr:hypothetical protein [Microbacterium sp.]